MQELLWLTGAGAVISAGIWLSTARRIIGLRRRLVRLHPVTGDEIPAGAVQERPDEVTQLVEWPTGDGRMQRLRYTGSMVRRWDRLAPDQQRRLTRRHTRAGLATLVLAVLALALRLML